MASILFIRRLFSVQDRVVEFDPYAAPGYKARCPLCEFCGFPPYPIEINKTRGEIRQCTCTYCLITFRAVGPTAEEKKKESAAIDAAQSARPRGRPAKTRKM